MAAVPGSLSLSRQVTREAIALYAEASGDHNPIHVDEAFARQTPFGGVVAHGMLTVAYVSEMMAKAFGERWLTTGILRVRFKAPARPGETMSIAGQRMEDETIDGKPYVKYAVACQNEKGQPVVEGQALVAP